MSAPEGSSLATELCSRPPTIAVGRPAAGGTGHSCNRMTSARVGTVKYGVRMTDAPSSRNPDLVDENGLKL